MRAQLSVVAAIFGLAVPAAARSTEEGARSGPYSLELIDGSGAVLPTFPGRGRTYVLGTLGQRYSLRLRNGSGQRVEFVAAVDGRDVLDGQPSAWERRGYVVEPYGELVIDGFRVDRATVAAFRFSSVRSSYASRMGDARDVGVIGVAVFTERPRPVLPPPPEPMPWNGPTGFFEGQANRGASAAKSESMRERDAMPSAPAADQAAGLGASASRRSAPRPGLGTEFGEARSSRVQDAQFERESARPAAVLSLRYDDRPGLLALGIDLGPGPDSWRREQAEPFRRNAAYAAPPPGWNGR